MSWTRGAWVGFGGVSVALAVYAFPRPDHTPPVATRTVPAEASDAGAILPPPSCDEVVARAERGMATPDDVLTDSEHDAILYATREAVRPGNSEADACRPRLFNLLADAKECGRAHSAVAAGLFGVGGVDPRDVTRAVSRAAPGCSARVVEAAGFAAAVDDELVETVAKIARTNDGGTRRSAWLTYGSLGEIARATGRGGIYGKVDRVLAAEIANRVGSDRLLFVKAGGNAGCTSCIPAFVSALKDADPDVRRAGAAGFRFIDTRSAVNTMCDRLEKDTDLTVREIAGWSLQWRGQNDELRATCLVRAAATDGARAVRQQATQSLAILAYESDPARAALVHLTGEEAQPEVRRLAMSHLMSEGDRLLHVDERAVDRMFRPTRESDAVALP